jgi:hypothetical protein
MAAKVFLIGFKERHPKLALRNPEILPLARCKGLNKAEVSAYPELLRKELTDLSLIDKLST